MIDKIYETTKDSLIYYKDEETVVHVVLRNRRFYNGLILEIRDTLLIFNDNKIGKIPISLKDIYLIETFHEPNGDKNGGNE